MSGNLSDYNEVEDTMTVPLHHLLTFLLNKSHKDNQEDKEEDHHVAKLLMDDLFTFIQ